MESNIAIFSIIGLIIWAGILYSIVRGANDTTKRDKIQLQNQKLLALIAEKLGVEVDKIKNVIN